MVRDHGPDDAQADRILAPVNGEAEPEAVADPLGPIDEQGGGVRLADMLHCLAEQSEPAREMAIGEALDGEVPGQGPTL